jgi:hypothetical protein
VRSAATSTWRAAAATYMVGAVTLVTPACLALSGVLWGWPFGSQRSEVDQALLHVLKAQLDRCGPENLVCPHCATCVPCAPWWAVAAVTLWAALLVAFCVRGIFRFYFPVHQGESERPRRDSLPAGVFQGSSSALEDAWHAPVPSGSRRPVDLVDRGGVVTPSSLRLRR